MELLSIAYTLAIVAVFLLLARYWSAGGVNRHQRDLNGKVIVMTGGTSGIGKEVLGQLVESGATVVVCSSNVQRGEELIKAIKCENKAFDISYEQLDLNNLESVQTCAKRILAKHPAIDILMNNAGVMAVGYGKTQQGFERHMGINYVGHFLFTTILLPAVQAARGRVINTSSIASMFYHRREFPFTVEKNTYKRMRVYAESKLAMAVFARELAERYEDITAVSLHPGCVRTELWQHLPLFRTLAAPLLYIFFKSPFEGSQTSMYCIHADTLESGAYYADCAVHSHNALLDDKDVRQRLWDETFDQVKGFVN